MSDIPSEAEPESAASPLVQEWAMEAARSIDMARRLSRVCLWLAGATAVVGVVTAGVMASTAFDDEQLGPWEYTVAQVGSILLTALLPVAVFLIASGLLRLYAIRFETELLPDDDEPGDDEPQSGLPDQPR